MDTLFCLFYYKKFSKVLIDYFVIGNIIIYYTIIILNILNNIIDFMILKIVKGWLA